MHNKELLVEVNRIKEMMGLLLEGTIEDGTRKLLIVLGYSNEWIDNLAAKTVGELNFSKIGNTLAGLGISSYDNLVANASDAFSRKAGEIVTSDEIFAYLLKTAPEAIESMNSKISVMASELANKTISNLKVSTLIASVDPAGATLLKGLIDAPYTGAGAKSIAELENGLKFVRSIIASIPPNKKGVVNVPKELRTLEEEFSKKIIEQSKQVSNPRPPILVPKKFTPEEIAARKLVMQALEDAAKLKGAAEGISEAIKQFGAYKGLSDMSKEQAMKEITDLLNKGYSEADVFDLVREKIIVMLKQDVEAAEILRKNRTWNKYIAPWLSRRVDSPIKRLGWFLAFGTITGIGWSFRDALHFGIQGAHEIDKELRQAGDSSYEDSVESFKDFLVKSEKYTVEEARSTTKKLGVYYDKEGNGFKYIGDPDFIFEPVGTTPVVTPGGVKTMAEFQIYANKKATDNGLTLSNFTEDANSFTVDATVGGQDAGSITKKKDGSDWN